MTPPGIAAPAAAPTPSPVGALPARLSTFEDCLQLIGSATSASDVNVKDAALRQLETFFKTRIARKSNEGEKDGTAAVKRAMAARFAPPATANPVSPAA